MELLKEIFALAIGGCTIGAVIIYLGKFILSKSSELLLENYKNQLEISKNEHQIKFSKLHEERAKIIEIIYQDFYELETKLEHLTTIFQGSGWTIDKKRDEDAIKKYTDTCERLERSRIYFPENLCDKLSLALDNYSEVIEQMLQAKNQARYESEDNNVVFPGNKSSLDLWKIAEKRTKNEIKNLRLELATEFRELIGVK
ncbi:hypothetical protein OA93_00295 [Flavobacterium sp. KMS]|uniref:hypothetical protein n=1 Tax=Flavobacterium sp. KMS TaxID=1566023 RepID=UPI000580428E|nr:hypothetical protein [Flavobacterium sp. KMS]KIC00093.1 hypothetical protein OA93_00295 [Flavobacterium sp. KMS]